MSYDSPVTFIQRLRDAGHPVRVHPHQLPDGDYDGEWSGFNAIVTIGEDRYQMATNLGIKGEGIACVVKVENGRVTVSAEEKEESDKQTWTSTQPGTRIDQQGGEWVKKPAEHNEVDPNSIDEAP